MLLKSWCGPRNKRCIHDAYLGWKNKRGRPRLWESCYLAGQRHAAALRQIDTVHLDNSLAGVAAGDVLQRVAVHAVVKGIHGRAQCLAQLAIERQGATSAHAVDQ